MMSSLRAAAAACALAAVAFATAPARAAVDLQSYEFGGFVEYDGFFFGDFVGGVFTLAVDTETDAVGLHAIDLGFGDDLGGFNTANSSAYRDGADIVVRGLVGTFNVSTLAFQLRFAPEPLAFLGLAASFDSCSEFFCVGAGGEADEGFIRRTDAPAPVPEPAAWALLILGFAGAGAALRRRYGPARTAIGEV